MQSPEIVLYTGEKDNSQNRQKWEEYSRYIFRGSDLLNNRVNSVSNCDSEIPAMIQSMLALYEFGDGSFRQKCLNFVRQGRLMEDYEDNAPWYGNLMTFFPVYHDLNIRQLRGYFTWRTGVRKGNFTKTCPAFAYIYIYELLNGIGIQTPAESLSRLLEFQSGFVDAGMGDVTMKGNMRRWLFEFAVINRFPDETVRQFAEKSIYDRDFALSVLRDPENFSDEEVFHAIARFCSSRTAFSTVLSKDRARGVRLFAEIWRHIASDELFTTCFGEKETRPWRPLANAVYVENTEAEDFDFTLNEGRRYFRRGGMWREESYNTLAGSRTAFMSLMHAADRRLRTLMKSGHYLRKKEGDDWAMPFIDKALEEIRAEEAEAARPKISIDLSGLDRIREDADITRDSLLTEDEAQAAEETAAAGDTPITAEEKAADEPEASEEAPVIEEPADALLDETQMAVLGELLAGGNAEAFMAERHLMPSVVADSINEALMDEIGDMVVECSDDGLVLVEDYIEDVRDLIDR